MYNRILSHLSILMETTTMRTLIATAAVLTVLLSVAGAQAELIVDLDPVDARFDSLTDNDDGAGGYGAGNPSGAENAAGLTFNVTFTPAAGDLDSTTEAVNLIEIGGDANGSGLYLLGGEVHFISKMDGSNTNVPAAFNDLNFASGNNMIGAKSSFGALSAGTTYSVAVVFDPIDASPSLEIAVKPSGGSITTNSFTPINVGGKTNWSGDDSATALRGKNGSVDIANLGGANTAGTSNPFREREINDNAFEGTAGQGLYWSAHGSIIPEPATLALAAIGLLGLRRRRR